MNLAPQTLEDVEAQFWRELVRAVVDLKAPYRWPVLATVGRDGEPAARTVVLRACDAEGRTLTIYTDARSAKVAQLSERPRAALTFFDRQKMEQVRAAGVAEVHTTGETWRAAAASIGERGHADYASRETPGAPIADPQSAQSNGEEPVHFCLLRVRVDAVDWLSLSRSGHRRAGFAYNGAACALREWRAP